MTLFEILDYFMCGNPIQRREAWGRDVYIAKRNNNIVLCRRKGDGTKEVLNKFHCFDRYFSLDDIAANDWQIME